MSEPKPKPARGRPRTITRERIADAGIALGLDALTFVGVANRMGVTQMALYKHVSSLEELRTLVAEEAFLRWDLPDPAEDADLETYLRRFSLSLWRLVHRHAGIAPYLLRRDWITDEMMRRTHDHQARVAERFDLSFATANQLVFSVAYHCCAVADASRAEAPDGEEVEPLHGFGLDALIAGAIALVGRAE
ncbi:TetR/AcrR family transcriptional regulator [Salipiger thiooxidans]|uniref:TetR/AcrR family transcriptional regulator n=1 Tax=Salipiger thiooxidans TaxID=282683 RepID=UPI001CD2CC05|nr:TetR/AcrR family transcriptional regulator [Salipiger thiooxidans]MCA0851314.1 TetR/AcrR family transcriptional regulator [Salipiger thiooxidans]